ncbi:sulfurtransferase [Kitasatospora sp. SUK 42]|uniref:sulfurtransferase n=1 Tax=Kitasatospora sp. SUK 42 TaxID=1588882 RepID=UPI0018CBD6C9|nr:sulfurtransferase [Kitasatospora sp. SUK 42]MBV2151610.1 sulfurtransferase [Kitasatospora sp. SUK 42]
MTTYNEGSPLISAAELHEALGAGRPPALLDVRYQLVGAAPGGPTAAEEYRAGHLPGAHFVELDRDLAAPPGAPGRGGRHPLPDPEEFGAAMRRFGVSADRPVVVYDGAASMAAARAWWLLRWAGHRDVRVLDGGFAAWRAAGLPVTAEVPEPEQGDFEPEPGRLPTVDADGAAAWARDGLLLDARSGERYRGETEPVDPRAGHVPGAVSAPTAENVGPDGRFRPAAELAARFRALGAGERRTAVYCGSGVTAAHQILALEVAGLDATLYPGSWSEWSSDPGRPVAVTDQPG